MLPPARRSRSSRHGGGRDRDPGGGRHGRRRGGRRLPRVLRRRDGDDGPARRRPRDPLGRPRRPCEPRLLRRRAVGRRRRRWSSSTVPFGEELVHYAVGPASCAVPGRPGGLDALWRAHGRLPWARLVEPALRLARERRRDAARARRLPGDARAGDDDAARGRADLRARRAGCSRPARRSSSRASSRRSSSLAEEGADSVYRARSPSRCSAGRARRPVTRGRPRALRGALGRARSRCLAGDRVAHARRASPACPRRSRGCRACAASGRRSACTRCSRALEGPGGRPHDEPRRRRRRRAASAC